ncbi:cupredoxin domain-containing protein [Paenibacillus ginsengihumi]|jgi:cytochrome c oxidase subunit 2|uniref:cupredoxin domain-containing protein n=1 Tax=Paenibacillus ginsengihumi TaxID=431596 RepID=UPI000366B4C8|nr:cupredoxin domain-containing protein [Paenibacillus ginsengihumi]
MKKIAALTAIIGLALALSACGASGEKKPDAPAANSGAGEGGAAQEVKIVATNFKFDQAEYKVKAGQPVTISLENKEGLHAVQISGVKVKLDNNSKTATFTPEKPGSYDIICSLPCGPGHLDMKSKLVVE